MVQACLRPSANASVDNLPNVKARVAVINRKPGQTKFFKVVARAAGAGAVAVLIVNDNAAAPEELVSLNDSQIRGLVGPRRLDIPVFFVGHKASGIIKSGASTCVYSSK
jgi:hypothetical protein